MKMRTEGSGGGPAAAAAAAAAPGAEPPPRPPERVPGACEASVDGELAGLDLTEDCPDPVRAGDLSFFDDLQ
jgi:hypothetical protein